jgi:hypothetical protein
MPASELLRPHELALIEEMVIWGTKVKDIGWVVRKPKAENIARKLYAEIGRRPPNGAPGSATSNGLLLSVRMQYVALAAEYQDAVKRGTDRNDAMLAVYRGHHWSHMAQSAESRVSPSIWMELSRRLDCGLTDLVRCGKCGGQHVVERETAHELSKCMWCQHSMPVHQFAPHRSLAYRLQKTA